MIFITGGVRSGKSSYAERRAISLHKTRGGILHYIATGRVYDAEMAKRVAHHELVRQQSGAAWQVHERTNQIDELFLNFHKDDVVLLDCVTTLVSNELFGSSDTSEEKWGDALFRNSIKTKLKQLFSIIAKSPWTAIIVSNELFNDLPTADEGTERYKQIVGDIHQHIVSLANEAILVEGGIPCWKKGEKPCLES